MKAAQRHRRKAVDVHCNDAESNQCFCGIFSFCQQQAETEFAFRETEFSLHFNSICIVLISNFLVNFLVCILFRSAKPFTRKTDT